MESSAKEKIIHAIESMEDACREARRRVEWAERGKESDIELAGSVSRCFGNGMNNAMVGLELAMSRINLQHAIELDALRRGE